MNKDLIVEIPKRFKKGLQKRFAIKNIIDAGYDALWKIGGGCPLCQEYNDSCVRFEGDIVECPFYKFMDLREGSYGCNNWIQEITKCNADEIYSGTKEELESNIKKIEKEAPKYIKWI